MRKNLLLATLAVCGALLSSSPLFAQEVAPPATEAAIAEPAMRISNFKLDYKVAENGAVALTVHSAYKVMREEALEGAKQYTIGYSTSIQKVDVLEAYTLKADGRRIDVPKDNYQQQVNSGHEGNAPSYSDETSLTIIFPDLAVGDTTAVTYTQTDLEPIFPGQFSLMQSYSKYLPYDNAQLSIDVPVALNTKFESYGVTEVSNSTADGRQKLVWSYKNPISAKQEGGYSEPFNVADNNIVIASTFAGYADISKAYGERAAPKAAVTPEIQKLADEIAGEQKEPRLVAKALYDWVVKNITYAGNCIGVGAVVPRDLGFVVGNKMGDCKDHATLLQALLSAKGIASTQALIGVNSIFTMPKTPVVSIVNHVINYIPSLDLYVDATSELPFGILPSSLYSKPVLLVDGYKEGQLTPPSPPNMRNSKVTTTIVVTPDGSAIGTVDISLQGYAAYFASRAFAAQTDQQRQGLIKQMLLSQGYMGSMDVSAQPFDEAALTFGYQYKFTLKDYMTIGTPGAMHITPIFANEMIAQSIGSAYRYRNVPVPKEFTCAGMKAEEDFSFTFPESISLLALPANVLIATPVQAYSAEYAQTGQTIKVSRKLDDTTKGPICAAAVNADYLKVAEKAWPDLRAQLVYKQEKD